MSRLSRVRRSLRTQTIRSLQLSRVGTVDAERIQGQTQKLQGQTHGLNGCAHARNAVYTVSWEVGHDITIWKCHMTNSSLRT